MVLPGVGGGWLDSRFGTAPLCTLLGFGLGLTAGIWHLLLMTKQPPRPKGKNPGENNRGGGDRRGE
jgi:F0F1-type ATP synthase assembly protein I